MADISKIKLANGTTVTLKDAQGRTNMNTLLGEHTLGALGTAAWEAVAAEVKEGATGLPNVAAVKSYVDSMIETIPEFDVVVVAEGGDLPVASADTFHKIYLKKAEGSATGNVYVEYITIRSGSEGVYTYSWEKVRDTAIDISGKVDKTQTIAGIALSSDISVEQLQTALGLGNLAYANTAKGSTTLDTVDSITMKEVTVAGNATVTFKAADATVTKANYTPAGQITGSAISGGSIDVTLKDSATATEATLSTTTFTPAGNIAAKEGGSFSALKSASFGVSDEGVQIEGTISSPAIELTKEEAVVATGLTGGKVASFKEGAFTPAKIESGFYTAGSAATWTGAEYTAPSLGNASKANFASEGVVAAIDANDAECLTFTTATTSEAVTAQGTFSAGNVNFGTFNGGSATVIDTTKFSGGSKAADTFEANELQSISTTKVNNVSSAALANAPVFTGSKYAVSTTSDTALKEVAFTATNSANIVNKVEYNKQVVDTQSFIPVAATLGFTGTEVEKALVTGVSYQKADENAAFSVAVTPETQTITKTAKNIEIEVSPVAKA